MEIREQVTCECTNDNSSSVEKTKKSRLEEWEGLNAGEVRSSSYPETPTESEDERGCINQ